MGKGSRPRPQTVSREELDLRGLYFDGRIGYSGYKKRYAKLMRAGLIQRSGRVIRVS